MRLIDADMAKAMFPGCRGFCEKIDKVPTCYEERTKQNPLTLEEAEKLNGSLYIERIIKESKENVFTTVIDPCRLRRKYTGVVSFDTIGEKEATFFWVDDYGKTWRCWAMKPTQEERKAAKWED